MKTYEQVIKTWCTSGPSGAAVPPQAPGPEWQVVGFGTAGDGHSSTYATIVYQREVGSASAPEADRKGTYQGPFPPRDADVGPVSERPEESASCRREKMSVEQRADEIEAARGPNVLTALLFARNRYAEAIDGPASLREVRLLEAGAQVLVAQRALAREMAR